MKVLIDTNIIMDEILVREPFYNDSHTVIQMCADEKIQGFLAAHTITNLFYMLRKEIPIKKRREILLGLLEFLFVESIDIEKLIRALSNENFKDFEDCLQVECAAEVNADYIITRNKIDFAGSEIPILTPAEFCNLFEVEEKI